MCGWTVCPVGVAADYGGMSNVTVPVFHGLPSGWVFLGGLGIIVAILLLLAAAVELVSGRVWRVVAVVAALVLFAGALFMVSSRNKQVDRYWAGVSAAVHEQVGATVLEDDDLRQSSGIWARDRYEALLKVDGETQQCVIEVVKKTEDGVRLRVSCSDSEMLPLSKRK